MRIIVDEGVRVASFALAPSRELIAELKDAGVVVIPSVGARRHAEKVAAWGADAVIVQGGEGGGHTGEVATTVLLPQVVDAVDIPVIAAGGFRDGRGLVAALAYGAAGIAMGTRFLLTSDSTVPDAVKARYLAATVKDVTVTTGGRRPAAPDAAHRAGRRPGARGPHEGAGPGGPRSAAGFRKLSGLTWSPMVRDGLAMKHGKDLSWSQVLLAANTPMLLKASMVEGRTDLGVMASGQVAGVIDDLPSLRGAGGAGHEGGGGGTGAAEHVPVNVTATTLALLGPGPEGLILLARPAFEDEALRAESGGLGAQPPGTGREGAAGAKKVEPSPLSSQPLDDRHVGLAAALAHRLQAVTGRRCAPARAAGWSSA